MNHLRFLVLFIAALVPCRVLADEIAASCIDAISLKYPSIMPGTISVSSREVSFSGLKFRWDAESKWIECSRAVPSSNWFERGNEEIRGVISLKCGDTKLSWGSLKKVDIYDKGGVVFPAEFQGGSSYYQGKQRKCEVRTVPGKIVSRRSVINAWQLIRWKYSIQEAGRSFWIETPILTQFLYPRNPDF